MKHWPTKLLGDLVLPTEQRDPKENPTEEFSYVDIAGVDNATKAIVTTKRIVGADAPSRARKVIRAGDIIVSTVRPNLNAVALVPNSLDGQICSTGFSVLRPSPKVMSGYLFAFTRSPLFIDYLVARTTGANYPAVNDGEVKDVPLTVPPLAEQERIVKLLDEADALRKLRAQADRRTAALIPALFHQMFGNTLANDKGWEMSELENLSLNITDGKHGDCRPAPNSGYYFVSVKDIVDGRIDYSKAREIMYEDFVEVHKRTKLEEGDVLITNSGTIGRMAVIDSDEKVANTTFQKSVAIIKPTKDCIDPNFLRFALDTCVKHLTSASSGSAQKNLLLGQLRRFKICVPPLALQKEFAERVTEIRALAAAQAASRQRLDNLFQSMLHQAFNGEL